MKGFSLFGKCKVMSQSKNAVCDTKNLKLIKEQIRNKDTFR